MTHDFWRITLDTNPDFCNISCLMCEDHSPFVRARRKKGGKRQPLRPKMPVALLESSIRQAAKLGVREIIPSTMGEPLTYPHFDLFLDLCHELGLKLNLTTNGTFPGGSPIGGGAPLPASKAQHNVDDWAQKIIPVASDVKISWNGASSAVQALIMPGTMLATHMENARHFIAVRNRLADKNYCSLTLQLTFMRHNLMEIADLVRLALELGFDRIKGHQLWVHFDEMKEQDLRADPQLTRQWNEIVDQCNAIADAANSRRSRPFILDNFHHIDPQAPTRAVGDCPFLGREIWIDPTGRFNVCCAPDKLRQGLGNFGNVAKMPLEEIIKGPAYRTLLQNYKNHPLCKTCSMRRPHA